MTAFLLLKSLHILGAVVFVGNIIVTAWWKAAADRSRDPMIIAFAQRQVGATDWVFTLGGAAVLAGAGIATALVGGVSMAAPWIIWGEVLFSLSGLVWLAVLVPLQCRLSALTQGFTAGGVIPDRYWRLEKAWALFGAIAVLLPLAAVPVMVWKAG